MRILGNIAIGVGHLDGECHSRIEVIIKVGIGDKGPRTACIDGQDTISGVDRGVDIMLDPCDDHFGDRARLISADCLRPRTSGCRALDHRGRTADGQRRRIIVECYGQRARRCRSVSIGNGIGNGRNPIGRLII